MAKATTNNAKQVFILVDLVSSRVGTKVFSGFYKGRMNAMTV
jgi:dihydroxyacetone kinase DhaKLM complex PTS-EIIA-like component DhaM